MNLLVPAPHSGTLAWKIPWTEEPDRLQSMRSLRVGHDWATSLSLFTFLHWRRKWQPTPVFLPGESQGWGAWWAAVYRVAQSGTQLKWLSSSSSSTGPDCSYWLVVSSKSEREGSCLRGAYFLAEETKMNKQIRIPVDVICRGKCNRETISNIK